MAKNYATIYASPNDSIALEQRFYLKEESVRGSIATPDGTDFFYTLPGGQINYSQEAVSSPHRSGRHHTDIIKEKKITEWNFPTFFNIDTTAVAGTAELDPALRTLWKALLGNEDTTGPGVAYDSSADPSDTFTLIAAGDQWAQQAPGCFVQGASLSFPGDGQAQAEWSGMGKTTYFLGIGKSTTDNNTLNTVTLQAGEGERFSQAVGGLVMIVEADGTTRSDDTPDGSPRKITDVTGDVVTLDGAALADADGAAADIYLVYYEPETPSAINDPQTGLVGSVTIDNLPNLDCVRSLSLDIQNDHEVADFCYGEDSLSGPLFIPGSRLTVGVSIEVNMNHDLVGYFNGKQDFDADDIDVVLGDSGDRHLKIDIPKAIFSVPSFSVPETGSIPVTFEGTAYQTALEAADEITVSYL